MLVDKEQVLKAKAKLGDKNADIIAELLHLEKYDAVNKKALCPWHLEDTPSFIYDSKRFVFHCFGCSKNTDIIDAYMFTGLTYLEAVQKLFEEAKMNIALGEKGVKTKYQYRYPHEEPINDKEHVYAYLGKRGISKATVDAVDIREDEHGNIVFNYYDSNDVLCLVKYRPSHKIDKSAGEIKSWCQKGADTTPLLFNMNRINVDQPLLLTEGECMPGNAEVLTPNGWIRLDEYNNEQVLQINTDLTGNFVTPLAYIKHEYDGDLYIDRKNNFASVTTANHNIVYIDYKGYLRKRKASEMPGIGTGFIPTVTKVNGEGIPFTNDQIALYLAISADCTIDVRKTTRHSRFSVKKDRKYFRLKELLERLNIPFFENKSTNRDGYKYIGFTTPDWVVSKTLPFEWIGQATLEQRKFIIEEMTYWDGNRVKTRNQYEYSSKEYANAVFMQTIAHTCGYMSTIIQRHNAHGSWYKVSVLLTKSHVSHQSPYQREHYNGMVYCVTVPTGMILVRQEGHISITGNCDTLAAIEAGYSNAVSVPFGANNYSWIEENFDWLEQFDSIIICSDNDEAGLKMQKECVFRLGSWRTKFIDIPPFHYDAEKNKQIPMKDLNHVLYYEGKQAVLNLIHNAKDSPVPSVQDISDIDETDLDEVDGITTGITELDAELMRLFYGTLTILSGQPGAGKTSFISQLVCNALDDNKNVWIYSREMPGWMTKSWLNYILAGGHNIKEYQDKNASTYYKVTQDAKKQINEHYRGRWTVYRDDASNKLSDIMQSMKDCVRKYGSKLLIIDNLMTLDLDSNEDNEMLKQTEAINELIYFAMKYGVAVILVAHPRKLPRDTDVGIYDISGTANIINLAHRTIGLKRLDKEKNDHDVQLTIIKDRMRGKAGKKINLYYDVPSRRFYSNEREYNHQYKWDTQKHDLLPYPHAEEREVYGDPL